MSTSGIDYRFIQPSTTPQFINKNVVGGTSSGDNSCFMFDLSYNNPIGWIDPAGSKHFYSLVTNRDMSYNLYDVINSANAPYATSVDISNSVYADTSSTPLQITSANIATYAANYSVGYYTPQDKWNTSTVATTSRFNGIVKTRNGNALYITLDVSDIARLTPAGMFSPLPFCVLWAPVATVTGKVPSITSVPLRLTVTNGTTVLYNKTLTLPACNTKLSTNNSIVAASSYTPHRIMIDINGSVWVKSLGSGDPNGGIFDFFCSSGYEETNADMSLAPWNNMNVNSVGNISVPFAYATGTAPNQIYSYPINSSANSVLAPFLSKTTPPGTTPTAVQVSTPFLNINGTSATTYNNQLFILSSQPSTTGTLPNGKPCYLNNVTITVDASFALPFVTLWGCNATCGFTQDNSKNYLDLCGNIIQDCNGVYNTANAALHPTRVGTLPYGSATSPIDMPYPTVNILSVQFPNNPSMNVTMFPSLMISRAFNPTTPGSNQLTNIAPSGYRYMTNSKYANRIVIDSSCNVWVKCVAQNNPAAGLTGISSWIAPCP